MSRPDGSRGIVLVVAAVFVVAAGAVLVSQPREGASTAPANSTEVARDAQPEKPAPAAAATATATATTGPSSRPRSPLERSPGYYPPDDPESMSVVTGRREAPLVDFEFRGGGNSARDLALQLLSALGARDENALHALRIARDEFEAVVWPELPESRPITNITSADAWEASEARSLSSADRAVGGYGGRPLELLRIEAASVVPYKNFTLHRGTTITARDTATGEVFAMTFASSFVERRGRFKVVLYRD